MLIKIIKNLIIIFSIFIVFGCKSKNVSLLIKSPQNSNESCQAGQVRTSHNHECDIASTDTNNNNLDDDNLDDNKTNQAQDRIVQGVAECDDKPGEVRQDIQLNTSKRDIFLRCLFMGGELQNCIDQNNCQVVLDQETCEQELEALKRIYPNENSDMNCVKMNQD